MDWINAKEQAPPEMKMILVCDKLHDYVAAAMIFGYRYLYLSDNGEGSGYTENIEYWRPVPEPPKEFKKLSYEERLKLFCPYLDTKTLDKQE